MTAAVSWWAEIGNVGRAVVIVLAGAVALAVARALWRWAARSWRRSLADVITEYAPKPVIDKAMLREAIAEELAEIKHELRTDNGVSLRQAITNMETAIVHIEGRQAAVERVLAEAIGRTTPPSTWRNP